MDNPTVTVSDFGLTERIRNIVFTPRSEWRVIQAESTSVGRLYCGYVMPMAGFASLMAFLRMSVVGVDVPTGGTIRVPLASGVFTGLLTFVMSLVGLYLVGLVINSLASAFGGRPDQRQALKTAAYALTPAWLGTALSFLPMGNLLQFIAGLYGVYVLYIGLPIMMQAKEDGAGGYASSVVACALGVGILFGLGAATLV
jgi:Yip1-like protein